MIQRKARASIETDVRFGFPGTRDLRTPKKLKHVRIDNITFPTSYAITNYRSLRQSLWHLQRNYHTKFNMKISVPLVLLAATASTSAAIVKRGSPSGCANGVYLCCNGSGGQSGNGNTVVSHCNGQTFTTKEPADNSCNTGAYTCNSYPSVFTNPSSSSSSGGSGSSSGGSGSAQSLKALLCKYFHVDC